MLFNTPVFLVFLAIVFPVAYFSKGRFKKSFLLACSYLFYGYWDWRFCSLLLISTAVDYSIGRRLGKTEEPRVRKRLVALSLCTNLGILGFFKYFNFFVDSFERAFAMQGPAFDYLHINVILPVGISFYTFQTLSYTIDVYRKRMQPTHSLLDFSLFVAFFPQLVAGPIERARSLLPQISKLPRATPQQIEAGIVLIAIGMFKKVMIGDAAGRFVDHIFAEPGEYLSFELVTALILFSVQIYADFSGYTSIARGTGKLLGIDLMENFRQPYFSANLTEFWRRWHISLSQWLRDYLYIWGLGGNRRGARRTYVNLMITMLLGGLWHGANWTFVVWGGLHGVGLAAHRYFLRGRRIEERFSYRNPSQLVSYLARVLLTNAFVLFAWLFFRSPDFETAAYILGAIVDWQPSELTGRFAGIAMTFVGMIWIIDFFEYYTKKPDFLVLLPSAWRYGIVSSVSLFTLLYIVRHAGTPMPFIYFQF
ncbi:MAG: MBOAT family O-acyltransferase [Myxococcota bacterium]